MWALGFNVRSGLAAAFGAETHWAKDRLRPGISEVFWDMEVALRCKFLMKILNMKD